MLSQVWIHEAPALGGEADEGAADLHALSQSDALPARGQAALDAEVVEDRRGESKGGAEDSGARPDVGLREDGGGRTADRDLHPGETYRVSAETSKWRGCFR